MPQRLDKIISSKLNLTRLEARRLIKDGRALVDGAVVKDNAQKVNENSRVVVDGKALNMGEHVYIMMNKPRGVICAVHDRAHKTVLDLLPSEYVCKGLFPAGRLDKDTTGFVLITNDGAFAHSILSPSRHVAKTYTALLDKPINDEIIAAFRTGVDVGEEKPCKAAELHALDDDPKNVQVKITQGIYHQVKRMFKAFGITVLELNRTHIGNLALDEKLHFGECRYITKDEINLI